MIMRLEASIKSVPAIRGSDSDCFAQFNEQVQIAINCSQTDIWKFFPYTHVNCIGSRV